MKSAKRNQSGFSILSLMIASVIGIFIMAGAGKVYIDSKHTFNARSSVAAAVENYRFAMLDMRRSLVMAGRGIASSLNGTVNGPFPGVAADGAVDSDGDTGSSVVAVRYASGPAPCGLSGEITTPTIVRFYVDADENLVCEARTPDHPVYAQPLVSGIVQMRALYGVDTDTDGIANQYVRTSIVDGSNLWVNVVSVRIGIIASSGEGQELPAIYQPATAEPLDLLGEDFTPTETNRTYKSASTTIAFRNLDTTKMYRQ
ncbi:MAG: PilW family protein [Candidatus Thiodiazotropha sp.]